MNDAEHDMVKALVRWVEEGKAPERIIATKYANDNPANGVVRTRPLSVYPQEAVYKGSGNSNDAASFECRSPSSYDDRCDAKEGDDDRSGND